MIGRLALVILLLGVLPGCTNENATLNLSSGIQYVGKDPSISSQLESENITYKNDLNSIDREASQYQLILIESEQVNEVSKEEVRKALKQGFYIFLINMTSSKPTHQKFNEEDSYEVNTSNKTWVEQVYLDQGEFKSSIISTSGDIKNNLPKWLRALDRHKIDSEIGRSDRGESTSINEEELVTQNQLPEKARLSFTPINLKEFLKADEQENWELENSIHLGDINGKGVRIQVYEVNKQEERCGAQYQSISLLHYNGQTFGFYECTSNHLKEFEEKAIYKINKQIGELTIVGGIELSANGQGRMVYVLYDNREHKFVSFEDWGVPHLIDLDNDGSVEFISQFEGSHLNNQDVSIYRWNDNRIEKSEQTKKALNIDGHPQDKVQLQLKTNKPLFNVSVLTDQEDHTYLHVWYRYVRGELQKQEKKSKHEATPSINEETEKSEGGVFQKYNMGNGLTFVVEANKVEDEWIYEMKAHYEEKGSHIQKLNIRVGNDSWYVADLSHLEESMNKSPFILEKDQPISEIKIYLSYESNQGKVEIDRALSIPH